LISVVKSKTYRYEKNCIILGFYAFICVISFSQNSKAFHFTPDTTFLPDGTVFPIPPSILVEGYAAGQTLTIDDLISVCVNMEHHIWEILFFSLFARVEIVSH
jgi:hypothetical protein